MSVLRVVSRAELQVYTNVSQEHTESILTSDPI
jgi:hypothetical protein